MLWATFVLERSVPEKATLFLMAHPCRNLTGHHDYHIDDRSTPFDSSGHSVMERQGRSHDGRIETQCRT